MVKKPKGTKRILNRRAAYDYELGEKFIVGIALTGAETKALRLGHGQLRGAYAAIMNDELWLVNAQINPTRGVYIEPDQESRSRKLLAKRSEIEKMAAARQAGSTLVPLEIATGGRYIKLKLAVGRGKKRYDKRESLRRTQQEREARRSLS